MKRKINPDQEYLKKSTHTQLSYWFCVIAVGIEFFLGINNPNTYFGTMALFEAGIGLFAILFIDVFHGKKFKIYPEQFKPIHKNTFFRFGVTFAGIVLIQAIFQIVPLITSSEMALGVIMVAPIEEYFFRGILMEPFFQIGAKSKNKITLWTYNSIKKKPAKKISYIEIVGITFSATIFASVHINYYQQSDLMWMVWFGGIWLAFSYFWGKDLLPLILSHFALNIFFIFQYYQVIGL